MTPLDGRAIGSVPYLNAKPLVFGLRGVTYHVPSLLAQRFAAGAFDAALLPVFELLEEGGGIVVDGVAIGARGPVTSVFVAHRGELRDAARIVLDAASRTSVHLLRVLLAESGLGHIPCVEPPAHRDDARLLIGDPALRFRDTAGAGWNFLDLGAAWWDLTRLPFVFAVWGIKPGDPDPASIASELRNVARAGLAARPHIASAEPDPTAALDYLTGSIHYELGGPERDAIVQFDALCRKHGLLPPGRAAWEFI